MQMHFKIDREEAMAAARLAFFRAYPQMLPLLGQIEMVPAFDANEDFDGFLVSGEIQKKGTVS